MFGEVILYSITTPNRKTAVRWSETGRIRRPLPEPFTGNQVLNLVRKEKRTGDRWVSRRPVFGEKTT